ncbi:unnamed protein product, partial [marine sediment metagenome]
MFSIKKKNHTFLAKANIKKFGVVDSESFFGYYGNSPISKKGYTLCHNTANSSCQKPNPKEPVSIELFGPNEVN